MRRLKWTRRVTVAVIVVLLSAALGFALKRSTRGDLTKGAHAHDHAAGLEGVAANAESEAGDEVEFEHGDEAESGPEDEAEPGNEHEEHRH